MTKVLKAFKEKVKNKKNNLKYFEKRKKKRSLQLPSIG